MVARNSVPWDVADGCWVGSSVAVGSGVSVSAMVGKGAVVKVGAAIGSSPQAMKNRMANPKNGKKNALMPHSQ